jgi:hypothetical protein
MAFIADSGSEKTLEIHANPLCISGRMSANALTPRRFSAKLQTGIFQIASIRGERVDMRTVSGHVFFVGAIAAGLLLSGCNNAQPIMGSQSDTSATASLPATSAASAPAFAASASIPDRDVTANVKNSLNQSEMLKGMDISVDTQQGAVRLNGMLDTQAQKDEAVKIARVSDGAQSVQDALTLKK